MSARPTLSILVPTYRRAPELERLLRHLAEDPDVRDAGVSVLVSDNASPDGTAERVRALQAELSGLDLRLHVQDENVGGIRNVVWAVENAPETDYVWLMADDDLPLPGAIGHVLDTLAEHRLRVLHLPHGWVLHDGTPGLASPCPDELELFPTSRPMFVAYHHWLSFISATVVERAAFRRALVEAATDNEWGPHIWYVVAGRDGPCAVAGRRLVVGQAGTSWEDKRATVLATRVIEAYDDGFHLVVDPDEFAVTLDGRYAGGQHLDCWQATPIETLIDAVRRFPASRELRRFLWAVARTQGRHDALATLDAAARSTGAAEIAGELLAEGEARFADGDLDGAVERFNAALAELPTSIEAWNDLAVALHALERDEALDAFEVALQLDPADQDALYNRAAWLAERGRAAEAVEDVRLLVTLRPDHAEASALLRVLSGAPVRG